MFAKAPSPIKSVQLVTRTAWASTSEDDTITAVKTDRTLLLPINGGNNRIYGSSNAGDQSEYINFDLQNATTIRWTRNTSTAPTTYGQILAVVEFFDKFRSITTAATSRLQGVGTSASPTQQTTDITITPPTGASTARAICLPACLTPDYGGNPTYFYPTLTSTTNVRFTRAYGSDVYRTMRARIYWF